MPHQASIKIIDISRPISKLEAVYPGNPKVILEALKTFKKDGSSLSNISLGLHTASHLDGPSHYVKKGSTIDKVNLSNCVGWARVVDATKFKSEVEGRFIEKIQPKSGEIILFKTKNSVVSSGKSFNQKFIHLNESAARVLVRANVKAVGTDGPSIRKFHLKPDTVHPLFLRAGILIYEGLDFKKAKPGRYFFIGLPLKIVGGEASPVRAVLLR